MIVSDDQKNTFGRKGKQKDKDKEESCVSDGCPVEVDPVWNTGSLIEMYGIFSFFFRIRSGFIGFWSVYVL